MLLDFPYQIDAWFQGLRAGPPVRGANFIIVPAHENRGLKLPQYFVDAPPDALIVELACPNHAVRIDNECCAYACPGFLDEGSKMP